MAILAIGLVTIGVTASFMAVGSERRVNNDDLAQTSAFTVAQLGLDRYMNRRNTLGYAGVPPIIEPVDGTELALPINGDTAYIRSWRVREAAPGRPALYLVRSRGVSTKYRIAGTPNAERIVSQLAVWNPYPLPILAGWTSLSGMRKNGTSGTLSGNDACGKKAAVAGVAVPNGQYSGKTEWLAGSPPLKYLGDQSAANAAVNMNWSDIRAGRAFPATHTVPGTGWPTAAQFADPNFWPVILVNGNGTLPNGRGLVIVTGDLTINGGITWDGILLIGENITSNGANTVYGAVMTGLDEKIGEDQIIQDAGNGTKIYQFHSCHVEKAATSAGALLTWTNTWADTWTSYQ
jgi:hypothetical protein